jgi:hypothetical protein
MLASITLSSAAGPPQKRRAKCIDGLARAAEAGIRIGRFSVHTAVCASLAAAQRKAAPGSEVIIVRQAGRFQLLRDPQPYFIKEAEGCGRWDERHAAGRISYPFGWARLCPCRSSRTYCAGGLSDGNAAASV